MKIVLLEDVKNLGKKDETVTVSDGYARNYLIPKKLGAEATQKNLKAIAQKKKGEERMAAGELKKAQELSEELLGKQAIISMRSGEGEKFFGSVGSKEVAQAYKEQFDVEIDKKKIQLAEPIRSYGVHQIAVKLHPQVTGTLNVLVKEV